MRPAELVDETLEDYREEAGDLARSEEDLLSYALFPQTARAYLERHRVGLESDVFGVHDRYLSSQPGAALQQETADRVGRILELVEQSDLDEVVIEEGDLRMTVRKAGTAPVAAAPPRRRRPHPAPPWPTPPPTRPGRPTATTSCARSGSRPSTARRRPSEPSFVEVGDRVEAGQTLCILEMMKMMNELTADIAGVVREILVENGATVQYGQPLFHIEPA